MHKKLLSFLPYLKFERWDRISSHYPTFQVFKNLYKENARGLLRLFIIPVFAFLSSHLPTHLSAQSTLSNNKISDNDWKLDASVNGVQLYYSLSVCEGKKVVFLRLVNKNSFQVNVSWKEVFTTQAPKKADGYLGEKKLLLPPGEISEMNCKNPSKKDLLILPDQVSPTYLADILKFEYKEILVTKAD